MSNPLIEQFIIESRDYLQRIGEILIALEENGEDKALLNELFRLVHTLKGNSGLFDFPSMTKLLHASEDLMNTVREGTISYTSEIADLLLAAMDTVSMMIDEIEDSGSLTHSSVQSAEEKTMVIKEKFLKAPEKKEKEILEKPEKKEKITEQVFDFSVIPEEFRMKALKEALKGKQIIFIKYSPEPECFYKGEDPLYLVRNTPELIWARSYLREEISEPSLMDIYQCITDFELLSSANKDELSEHFKYVLDQVKFSDIEPANLIIPEGEKNGGPVYEDFVSEARKYLEENNLQTFKNAVKSLIELSSPELYFASVLRWIELLIEHLPETKNIIEALLQSLETMTPPVFRFEKEPVLTSKKEEKAEFPEEFLKILDSQKIVLEKLKSIEDNLIKSNILKSIISSIENGLISLGKTELLNEFKEISQKISPDDFNLLEKWIEKNVVFL